MFVVFISNRFHLYSFSDRKDVNTQVLPFDIRWRSDGTLLYVEESEGVVSQHYHNAGL